MSNSSDSEWLKKLHDILLVYKLPAGEMVAAGNVLKIMFRTEPDPLRVEIFPEKYTANCFQSTGKFSVRYEGEKQLTPYQEKILKMFILILEKVEHTMPDEFYDSQGLGLEKEDPAKRIMRLFPFTTVETFEEGSLIPAEVLVRATFRCNQKCPFCSAPVPVKEPDTETLIRLFDMAADTIPGALVTLTGGEPTIRKDIVQCVDHLMSRKEISLIKIQTNAVVFAGKKKHLLLSPSPKLQIFVSMHSMEEKTYDMITGTRGQFMKAVKGTQNLLSMKHYVVLNIVLNKYNINDLNEYILLIEKFFSKPRLPELHFSILMCPPHRTDAVKYLVRYSDLVEKLEKAVALAEEKGIFVSSLLSSSHASITPCILSGKYRKRPKLLPIQNPFETGYEDFSKPWIKKKTCVECAEDRYCLGLPRQYALQFGLEELKPTKMQNEKCKYQNAK
jgi:sulfatase maturation enzyme AslB (radical SAM superfamily)